MFAQVIQAPALEKEALRRHGERWVHEIAPRAGGWLGATWGVSDQGDYVAVLLFDSAEAARRARERPEPAAWWQDTERLLDAGAMFHDCAEVDLLVRGRTTDAGFVQVSEGRADRRRLRTITDELDAFLSRRRPDVIGGTVAWHGDEWFTRVLYFTSEDEARRAEQAELAAEDATLAAGYASQIEIAWYVDLRDPWVYEA